jgi:predicted component of type VI protein secretion system
MRLHLSLVGGPRGGHFELDVGQRLSIGRGPECDIQVGGSDVERRHCEVRRDEDGAWLCDRTGGNRCLLNDERLGPWEVRRLRPGDVVQVGESQFRVTAQVRINPAWLRANERAALELVRAALATGDLAALPVVADALEEAGCDDAELLAHCREPGTERCARWVLQELLAATVPREG